MRAKTRIEGSNPSVSAKSLVTTRLSARFYFLPHEKPHIPEGACGRRRTLEVASVSIRKSALLGTSLCLFATSAHAQPTTFSFTSRVADVAPELVTIAADGDSLTGTFTFDPTAIAEPSDAPGMRAIYPGAGSAVTLQVGNYAAKASGFYITVLNDWVFEGQALGDVFLVSTTHETLWDGPEVGAYSLGYFALVIRDPSGAMLDSIAIPTTAAVFDGGGYTSSASLGLLTPLNPNAFLSAGIQATDVTIRTVPTPGTLALLGAAALGVCSTLRRRARADS